MENLEKDQSEIPDLLVNQKQTIRLMRRSHKFLMAYIFANAFSIYVIMSWVALTIWMLNLPFQLLSIATMIIIIPIIIFPFLYKRTKERFSLLQEAGKSLHDAEVAIDANQIAQGLTSYIFFIFDILRPSYKIDDEFRENEVENVRKNLNSLTRDAICDIFTQGIFLTAIILYFLIPEFLEILEGGGPLLFPLIILCFVIGFLIARWFIFLYWRFLIRRWLKFYQGFMAWGEELERMFSEPSETGPRGDDV